MTPLITDENEFLIFTAKELMVAVSDISLDTDFRSIESWSSLTALIYVSSINEETSVFISSADLVELIKLKDVYNLILSRLHGTV